MFQMFQTLVFQNVFNEVLSAWFKFQMKIPTRCGVCIQGEWLKYSRPSPPLSKNIRKQIDCIKLLNAKQMNKVQNIRIKVWKYKVVECLEISVG